jgi:putative DNA primase/helicase
MIVERLLNISGEDSLTIDRKYLPPVTLKLSVRLVVCSNELPQFNDASGALAHRMIVLRMARTFLGQEDLGLLDRLKAELPGILRWSAEGWAKLRDRGHFDPPETSGDSIREMREIGSPVQAFVGECCILGADESISRPALYKAYADWSKARGSESVENESVFGRNLKAVCSELKASQKTMAGRKIRVHVGIGLRPDLQTQEIANGSDCH